VSRARARLGAALVGTLLAGGTPLFSAAAAPVPFRADPAGMPAYELPAPLRTVAGRGIRTAAEWESVRRPEVLELFRQHVYGRVPAVPYRREFRVVREDPRAMNGAATLRLIEIVITTDRGSHTIPLTLFVPNRAPRPAPAFLLICNRPLENIDPTREKKSEFWPAEEGIARGYAMAAFFNGHVSPDDKKAPDTGIRALLAPASPAPDDWGTLATWAWGASRCLDYLVTDPGVAADRVAVIGHSRGGKTALWAGAEDPRFALVISNDSGCGGAALSRRRTPDKESVARINGNFPHWFNANFKRYNDRVDDLPVDQHLLVALIAPRAVAVGSASEDHWADPRGEFLSVVAAAPVYRLYGRTALGADPAMPAIGGALHGDGAHYHLRAGKHNLTLADWTAYWDFADRAFRR
jgi:hypothetical protein